MAGDYLFQQHMTKDTHLHFRVNMSGTDLLLYKHWFLINSVRAYVANIPSMWAYVGTEWLSHTNKVSGPSIYQGTKYTGTVQFSVQGMFYNITHRAIDTSQEYQ